MSTRKRLAQIGGLSLFAASLVFSIRPGVEDAYRPSWTLGFWAVGIVLVDLWSYRFSKRVHWSWGSAVIAAPLVLSEPGSAPIVAGLLGLLGALTDSEIDKLNIERLLANAGQLTLAGAVTGLVYEFLRPGAVEPSAALVAGVVVAFSANIGVNAAAVSIGARYAYGRSATRGMGVAIVLLGWRKIVAAVAAAAIASTVAVLGPAWTVFAVVQIAALGAIPIVRAKLEARRRDIMQAVTSALNARGVVGSAHDRLEDTALTLGHRLSLTADEIEQLRYVSLLYAMTDNFATSLPRSFEEQLRGLGENAFSSALLLGLPLNDVADPAVVRIAEAAAEYESLVRPVDGGDPLLPNEAAAEMLRSGTDPNIIAALLDEKPLPDSYLRAWEIDPASPWQRPMRWIAEHASSS